MKRNVYKKILTAVLPCMLLSMLCLGGCSGKQEPVSKTGFLFDTVVTITLYGSDPDQEELLEECFRKGEGDPVKRKERRGKEDAKGVNSQI